MLERPFSHNDQFTDYMRVILEVIKKDVKAPARILDMPAGYGRLAAALRTLGHDVTCADINNEQADYINVNMEYPLPFATGQFDMVICMEGVEHVINQVDLLQELVRITRTGGLICISTPNISNFWSRLTFLFTGHFYQFPPDEVRVTPVDKVVDKGHISPLSIYQLGYFMAVAGAGLRRATGDKLKKKLFIPLAALVYPWSLLSARRVVRRLPAPMFAVSKETSVYFNPRVFLSRSLIAFFVKH